MKAYKIAKTGLETSRIAYGCMKIGASWDRQPLTADQKRHALKLIETAVENDINFFDHADIYTIGKSEAAFAEAWEGLSLKREDVILQSKCGIRFPDNPNPGDPHRFDFSYQHIVASAENSLRRLKTEYLDIFLLHRPDPLVEPEEVARAFDDLQSAGKVRHFGVSNHSAAQMAFLQHYLDQPLVVNQVEMNLLHAHLLNEGIFFNQWAGQPKAAEGTIEYCRMNNVLIQAWSPVAQGRLFADPASVNEANVKSCATLVRKLASEKGTTLEGIVLGWLLHHPAGIQPVVGTTTPERIRNSAKADSVTLSRNEWFALFTAARGTPLP